MDPTNPIMGQFVIDGSEFAPYAVDLAPGECQGMLVTREGFSDVCKEILSNQAAWGVKGGILEQEVTDLTTTNERIARIDIFIPVVAKLLEILTETRYVLDDKRQRIVMDAAKAVDRRAGKTPELKAKYEKTREYRSALAKKGLQTKAKNAQGEAGDEPPPPPPTTP